MKMRTVMIQLELETDAPMKYLKDRALWQSVITNEDIYEVKVRQATATVAQPATERKKE